MLSGGIEIGQWHEMGQLFHDRGPYHRETSPLVCRTNQCTCFFVTGAAVMKELKPKFILHFMPVTSLYTP